MDGGGREGEGSTGSHQPRVKAGVERQCGRCTSKAWRMSGPKEARDGPIALRAAAFHTTIISISTFGGLTRSMLSWVHWHSLCSGQVPVVFPRWWTQWGWSLVQVVWVGDPLDRGPRGRYRMVEVGVSVDMADHIAHRIAFSWEGVSEGRRAWEDPRHWAE